MPDFKQKSFEFANDAIKLILTLATGVLAFTLTFLKDIIAGNVIIVKWALNTSWILLLFSIFFCLLTLLTLVGTMNELETNPNKTIYEKNTTTLAGSALVLFLAGMVFIVVFTWMNFSPVNTGTNEKKQISNKDIRDTTIVIVSTVDPKLQLKISPEHRKKTCTPSRQHLITQ